MLTTTPPNSFPSGDADWELLARYIAGELPDLDAARVRARVSADQTLQALVDAIARGPNAAAMSQGEVEAALARVHARMRDDRAPRQVPLMGMRARRPGPTVFLAAAGAVLAIGVAAWYVAQTRGAAPVVAVAKPAVFRTTTGQRDSIVLADGTRAVLGPGSELTVAEGFPVERTVSLSGEARFEVVHDSLHPFTVRTAEAVISDIGTTFTVHSYGGAGAEVAVQIGAVALRAKARADRAVTLAAGDVGAVDASGLLTKENQKASSEDLAWLSGRLVFRDAPMANVRADLRRWHGVELIADSAIATRHLTASFRTEPRDKVIQIIALAVGATYEMRGDTVVMRSSTARPSGR